MPRKRPNTLTAAGLALLLGAAVWLQYLPVGGHDFINYDDPKYVTANLRVNDIVESLLVHPALSEALAEAAE